MPRERIFKVKCSHTRCPPVTARVVTCLPSLAVHLIPVSVAKNGVSSKSRKRIMPDPVTEPPGMDPLYEALLYCNIPSVAERSMEGRPACAAQPGTLWGLVLQTAQPGGEERPGLVWAQCLQLPLGCALE